MTFDTVAGHFDDYMTQACKRTFRQECKKHQGNKKGPAWYDAECRHKRALAIQAGERVLNTDHANSENNGCILENVLRKLNPHISMTVVACGKC